MFKNHLRFAWRNIRKNTIETLINITGLSVGMASALLMMLWVQNELNYDNYHPDANRLFEVKNTLTFTKGLPWVWESSPYPLAEAALKEIPGVTATARLTPVYDHLKLELNGNTFMEDKAAYIDKGWFNLFHYDFIAGSVVSFNQNPYSLVLTQSRAKHYFGNADAIGKIIKIDTVNYEVSAVVKDNPANSSFQYDILIPVAANMADPQQKKNDMQWGNFRYITVLKLDEHADKNVIAKKLTAIYDKNRDKNKASVSLLPLKDVHFDQDLQHSQLNHGNHKVVYVFGVLAVVLLVIACINYINLTTARASLRVREVSIKKIVGAGQGQLFIQFFTESFIIILISLGITLLLITVTFPYFNQFVGKNFNNPLSNTGLWKLLVITLLSASVINGIYPALLLSSFNPLSVFSGLNLFKVKNTSLRKALVIFQFTVSIVLIAVTAIIFKQLSYIQHKDASYNRSQVLSFELPFRFFYSKQLKDADRERIAESVKHDLLQSAAIEKVSMEDNSIIDNHGMQSGGDDWDGREKEYRPAFTKINADYDFQQIINLKIVAGRWFLPNSKADAHNFLLNETAVRVIGLHKPYIGQRFVSNDDTGMVVGIVKDFSYKSAHDTIGSLIISGDTKYSSAYLVKVAPGKSTQAAAAAEKVWKSFINTEPFTYTFLNDDFDKLYRDDQKASTLMGFFACVAILISCLGLFGLATFTALQRTKEISIRKVLGTSVASIINLVSIEFIRLVIVAFVIAIPLSYWAMSKWLEDFAYRVSIGPWVFVGAGLTALLIAVLTVSSQSVKVAVTNPVKSLRSE